MSRNFNVAWRKIRLKMSVLTRVGTPWKRGKEMRTPTSYYTIKSNGECEIVINKSRFIAYVKRVETEVGAFSFIAEIKKKHWDATHNCCAYVIGLNGEHQKADDDGEPGGTAGKPILETIKKNGLKNAVVIVTRYFGGVKLGAGGLVRAYTKAASAGINSAGIIERELYSKIAVKVDYALLGIVENHLHNFNYTIFDKKFTEKVLLYALVQKGEEELFGRQISAVTSAQADIFIEGEMYADKIR